MDTNRWARIIAAGGPWFVPKLRFDLDAPEGEKRLAIGLFSSEAAAWDWLRWKGRDGPSPFQEECIKITLSLLLWRAVSKTTWYILDPGAEGEERGLVEDLVNTIHALTK